MQFLLLVLAGRDFSPPDTIGEDTDAWVARADAAGRCAGDRLRPPGEALVFGPGDAGVVVTDGPRVTDDEQIVGFDVIECPDIEAARELVAAHPMARAGRIELRAAWGDDEG